MAHEGGPAHKIVSVILRFLELSCAVIVLGLLSRFAYLLSIDGGNMDGRLIYAMVVAGIGIVYSIFLCPPFDNLFLSFPFDFVLFVMWIVAYGLLQSKTAGHSCTSGWYYNYWGYYWGRLYVPGRVDVNGAGCAQWRTVLAFAFIAWFLHLLSGILGVYVVHHYVLVKDAVNSAKQQMRKMSHSSRPSNAYNRDSTNRDSTTMEPTQETANPTQPQAVV